MKTSTPAILAIALMLPALADAHSLPLRGNDLAPGERFSTNVHKAGIQAEGQDIIARRRVNDALWTDLKQGATDKKANASYVVYGKPIYAMAGGTVIGCWRNAPENPAGDKHPAYDKGLIPGGGNHLWVKQDDGTVALYAHAIPGSIPAALCPHNAALLKDNAIQQGNPDIRKEAIVVNGAKIKAGQVIGKVGNSGSSSGPHLHIHMEKDGKPVKPMFDRGLTTPYVDGKANINGPWTPIAGKQLPRGPILLWPPYPVGTWNFKGIKGEDFKRHADHMFNSGEMLKLATCQDNGASYDTWWVPAAGAWLYGFGMTADVAAAKHAENTAKGYKRVSNYVCGSRSIAVWRK